MGMPPLPFATVMDRTNSFPLVIPRLRDTRAQHRRKNSTHSEWKAFKWAEEQLRQLQFQPGKTVVKIFVAIFSQVRVCDLCRYEDMPTWMRDLRTAAGRQNVYLNIWQIRPRSPSAFDPGSEPAGVPLNLADLQWVPVNFTLK